MAKRHWRPGEDEKLVHCVNSNPDAPWESIARMTELGRKPKSCWGKYFNFLHPDVITLKRKPFTKEEDGKIILLEELLGNCWAEVAMFLHGRTYNDCKNRWNNHLQAHASFAHPVPAHMLQLMIAKYASLIHS